MLDTEFALIQKISSGGPWASPVAIIRLLSVISLLNQCGKDVDRPVAAATTEYCRSFLQAHLVLFDQCIQTSLYATKRLAMRREHEHVIRQQGFHTVQRRQTSPARGLAVRLGGVDAHIGRDGGQIPGLRRSMRSDCGLIDAGVLR